jgi:large subunit ribosomal protein L24e
MKMPQHRLCSFCKREIPAGTGTLVVMNNGAMLWYCSSKCRKNHLHLGRNPQKVKWVVKRSIPKT